MSADSEIELERLRSELRLTCDMIDALLTLVDWPYSPSPALRAVSNRWALYRSGDLTAAWVSR